MAASRTPTINLRPPARPRFWRGVAIGFAKCVVTFTMAFIVIEGLVNQPDNAALRYNALFIAAMAIVSVAYWLIVWPRVHVHLPGTEGNEAADLEGNTTYKRGRKARREAQPDEVTTIQVTRLSSEASRVTIVNDAPLPALRVEATVTLAREGDTSSSRAGGTISAGRPFSLPAHGSIPATMSHAFNHVGIYRLQSAGVRVYDLLGVLSRVNGTPGQWRVRVVPNIYRLSYGIPRDRKVLQTSLGIPDSPADALDYDRVRDWRPGDPLKTIHWKLVAHSQGELYTKLFETATTTSMTLLVDPYGPDAATGSAETAYHRYDTMLEGGLSLLEHARENGIAGTLRFISHGGALTDASWAGPAMRGWLVETAQRPRSSQVERRQSLVAIQSLQDSNVGYAIVATGMLTAESVEALIACHHAGVSLLVVHALPTSPTAEVNRQRAFDERLRNASIGVVALTDGPEIIREVTAS